MSFAIQSDRKVADVDRKRIRVAANSFVKKNSIVRPPCSCGNPKSELHHPDYMKPLLVAFLCKSCHVAVHQGTLGRPIATVDLRKLAKKPKRLSGEMHPNAVFTAVQVSIIRGYYAANPNIAEIRRLAAAFDVAELTIRNIVTGKSWATPPARRRA